MEAEWSSVKLFSTYKSNQNHFSREWFVSHDDVIYPLNSTLKEEQHLSPKLLYYYKNTWCRQPENNTMNILVINQLDAQNFVLQ